MLNNIELAGVWTAIVTPFNENMEIDFPAFETLVRKQLDTGVKGLVIAGTTGESPTLLEQEKLNLIKKAKKISAGKLRIMAGAGSNSTIKTIDFAKLCEEAGADSLLIVTPPYNKPSIAGLENHFRLVSENVKTPICLYHVPGRTGQTLSAEDLYRLSKINGIEAIKEASGDLALFSKTVALCGERLAILSGDDPTFLASLGAGGHGVISVLTNLLPKPFVNLIKLIDKGDRQAAVQVNRCLLPLIECLFIESNPSPVKSALNFLGLCQNTLRNPLLPCNEGNVLKIVDRYKETVEKLEKT